MPIDEQTQPPLDNGPADRGGTAPTSAELTAVLDQHRDRLLRMIRIRLDRRLSGRVDPEDVLQEAYLQITRRLPEYARDPSLPIFLWMRGITGQALADTHRHHLGAQMRSVGQEISLHRGALPEATSISLAAQLLGRMTSASRAAIRGEHKLIVQEALNGMDPIDREVLTLRHFEQLTNDETALALGLKKSAASQRYVRALKRLKEILAAIPDLADFR